jgi:uncharacterized membrane protein YgcG
MTFKRCAFGLIIAALVGLSLPAAAKDTVVESVWASTPVTIDGALPEWNDVTPVTDKASGGKYALKNDGRNLYIVMVLGDEVARSTILYTGMKIYVNAGAKKSKDAGILFMQKTLTPDELIASLEKKGEVVTEEKKAEIRKQKSYTVFIEEPVASKKGAAAGTEAKPEPALFRMAMRGQAAVYEFKIPLSRVAQVGAALQPGTPIKVGFEWGGMTNEIMKSIMAGRASSGSTARASAGSSDSGFSDTSGEGGGGGADFAAFTHDKRYSKHTVWADVKLAVEAK